MEKYYIYINSKNYVEGPYVLDADIKVEVSEEIYNQVASCRFYHRWKYENNKLTEELMTDDNTLKDRRSRECFSIIDNRSVMWYNNLTESQKEELTAWYKAWLDITETKIIPKKPEWLK